jgi:hypothetical protein
VWLKLKIRLQQRVEVLNTADKLSAAIRHLGKSQCGLHSRTLSLDSKAFTQSIEGEGRNDKVFSKGKHLFHKFIVFLLMQSLMLAGVSGWMVRPPDVPDGQNCLGNLFRFGTLSLGYLFRCQAIWADLLLHL